MTGQVRQVGVYDWDGIRTRRIRRAKWAAFFSMLVIVAVFVQNVAAYISTLFERRALSAPNTSIL